MEDKSPIIAGKLHVRNLDAARNRFLSILSNLALFIIAFVFMIPFIGMVFTSLKPENEVLSIPPTLFGTRIDWSNYVRAWTFFPFGRFLLNSVFVALATTVLAVTTSSLAAYAFSRLRFRGRDTLFLIYLGTLMIPQQVTVIPLFLLMKHFGWSDTFQAMIVPSAFTAFGTFLLRQFFLTIPYEMEEAGRIDGCSAFGLYFRIIMPMAKPGIATLSIFTFIGQWKSFLWPLIITNTDRCKTIPLGIYMFNGQYGTDWSGMMAAASIAIIPSMIIYAFFQRYLVEGISITGMGGR